MRSLSVLLIAATLGCAGRQRVASGPAPLRASLTVLRLGTRTEAIRLGEQLSNGELVRLRVTVSEPAYVYVSQRGPRGGFEALFPEHGERLVRPGRPLVLPGPSGYALQGAGQEIIQVVASKLPLGQVEPSLCRQLALACGTAAAREVRADDPPPKDDKPPADPGDERPGTTVHGEGDARGVVTLQFTFGHE